MVADVDDLRVVGLGARVMLDVLEGGLGLDVEAVPDGEAPGAARDAVPEDERADADDGDDGEADEDPSQRDAPSDAREG